MKCFYHRDVDAIGSCKACSKGLCGTCAVDVGRGLACRDSCVELVRKINELVDRNIRMSPASEQLLGKQPSAYLAAGVFAILGGILLMVLGQSMDGVFRIGMSAMGALAVLLGVWHAGLGWRIRNSSAGTR